MKISGKFEVEVSPFEYITEGTYGMNMGRSGLKKSFVGELTAESNGTMLSAMSPVKGSAGYVAVEQVVGTLSGKNGSFVLQHFGIMNRGEERLVLEVVPDTGTGDLKGLVGAMKINRGKDDHFYEFEYSLPD